jgi:hypothetical protein
MIRFRIQHNVTVREYYSQKRATQAKSSRSGTSLGMAKLKAENCSRLGTLPFRENAIRFLGGIRTNRERLANGKHHRAEEHYYARLVG